MKREGRQHGMVRSYRVMPSPFNPRPDSRLINQFDSPPTAGLFTKVSTKPTNHSKFTGKCTRPRCVECHLHPGSKSKDKAKGTHKLRSGDVVSNHRLVSWRVVDAAKPGLNFPGFSASRVLDHLDNDDYWNEDDDCEDEVYEESCELAHRDFVAEFEIEISSGAVEIEDDQDGENEGDEESGDTTSFCDVGLVWDRADEDEGWCLVVGEM
ncbi:hypothetical protein LOK49_LG01G04128 [Camellia lanceoleosa]|uniref:Uncharacterized protein n=1 Tax=Camellia lanceoleosa TaxID=1840588 RepID=A0ACC0ITZ9_9ERIC|nr:hypothetical protein LOK49_LG01G04128 [Camellia lanceoleosa]